MATSDNVLQAVITYQESMLGALQNFGCFLETSNKKFKDFQNLTANLGDTVSFDLPPRFTTSNSLVVSFEAAEQRVQELKVDQEVSSSIVVSAQQLIYNLENYMDKFVMSMAAEIGSKIESNVATLAQTTPYLFYGDGLTPINSSFQLDTAIESFRAFGTANYQLKGYLPNTAVPALVNSGLAQFAPDRNNREANSWELSPFAGCDWYKSNLLPLHVAGTEGQRGSTLTVISTTTNSDGAVTSITFSGTYAINNSDSVKKYDSFQFLDGVGGHDDLRFRTFVGHEISELPVQFQATANASSNASGHVTVSINPPLKATGGKNQNINSTIIAGMQAKVLPSHRCGLITSGDPIFLGMPRLPEEVPFPTSSVTDPATGASLRTYFGSLFGQNKRGLVVDQIWGKTAVPEYCLKLVFPA